MKLIFTPLYQYHVDLKFSVYSIYFLCIFLLYSALIGFSGVCAIIETDIIIIILEWTTRLDTSSRTLFVREGGRMSVRMSTSRRTSSYVITSDCY